MLRSELCGYLLYGEAALIKWCLLGYKCCTPLVMEFLCIPNQFKIEYGHSL